MRSLVRLYACFQIVASAILSISCMKTFPDTDSKMNLVGGEQNNTAYPAAVGLLLYFGNDAHPSSWCSGTIVREDLILTAAHCLLDHVKKIVVYDYQGTDFTDKKHQSTKFIRFPDYKPLSPTLSVGDVGFVVFSERPFQGRSFGKITRTPPKRYDRVRQVGYGFTKNLPPCSGYQIQINDYLPYPKRHIGYNTISDIRKSHTPNVPGQFDIIETLRYFHRPHCAATAGGDSGGPLINKDYEIVGIAFSAGPNCEIERSEFSSVTDPKIASFIKSVIEN